MVIITFGITLGVIGISAMAVSSVLDVIGKREEARKMRRDNVMLRHENTALKTRNELLETRVKTKQYTVDIIKQTQIDDLLAENRRLKMMLANKDRLLKQKWEGANAGINPQ